jgi:hypothetical protein
MALILPPTIRMEGDTAKAQSMVHAHVTRLLLEFQRLTRFQNLAQNDRAVWFDDGSVIYMQHRFGQDLVTVYAPPSTTVKATDKRVSYHLWIPTDSVGTDAVFGGLLCDAPGVQAFTEPFTWYDQRYLGPDGYYPPPTDESSDGPVYLGPASSPDGGQVVLTDVPPYTAAPGYTSYWMLGGEYERLIDMWDTIKTWKKDEQWYGAWNTLSRRTYNLYRENIATGARDLVFGPIVSYTWKNVFRARDTDNYEEDPINRLDSVFWTIEQGDSTGGGDGEYWFGGPMYGYGGPEYGHPCAIRVQTAAEDPSVYSVTFGVCNQRAVGDGSDNMIHEAWQYINICGKNYEIAHSYAVESAQEEEGWACCRNENVLYHWLFPPVAGRDKPFMLYRVPYENNYGEYWYGVADTSGNTILKIPSSGVDDKGLSWSCPLRVVKRTVLDGGAT